MVDWFGLHGQPGTVVVCGVEQSTDASFRTNVEFGLAEHKGGNSCRVQQRQLQRLSATLLCNLTCFAVTCVLYSAGCARHQSEGG